MDELKKERPDNIKDNIFTKVVRAGKRKYFFDVKETKKGERYITITERKKKFSEGGRFKIEKHKIFLYKEDFDKFADALDDIIDFIETGKEPVDVVDENTENIEETKNEDYTDVSFDDLDK